MAITGLSDAANAATLTPILLPDALTFGTSSTAEFLNGRQLADDVICLRGSQPHGRFKSRYALELKDDLQLALQIALTNWHKPKETCDTRNVLEAAVAAIKLGDRFSVRLGAWIRVYECPDRPGADARHTTVSLLGFNVGVELGQLAIVLVFFPLAYQFRSTTFYRLLVFPIGSVLVAVIAGLWMVERGFSTEIIGF